MLNDAVSFSEIYIVCDRTDLRYGIDSLAGVLRFLGTENPATAGTLYLFCGRRSDRIKGLVWEGDGFLLLYKKLANGSFQWPRNAKLKVSHQNNSETTKVAMSVIPLRF